MDTVLFFSPVGQRWTWRAPTSAVEELWRADLPVRIARQAEEAKFDALFIGSWLHDEGGPLGKQPFTAGYEPLTLMGALATTTSQIGLIGTASTTFTHPFNLARYLSSLDWLSNGRIGWNVVTSTTGAEMYGMQLPPHDQRYARARQHLKIATELWDAWDDDAVVNDREGGTWALTERIHPVDIQDDHFHVTGQLFMHRSPQGRPVIVQAGQSSDGMDFAARNAELIFTAQTDIGAARSYYDEIKSRAASLGRDPSHIRVLPGIMPIIGATAQAAADLEQKFDDYVAVEPGLRRAAAALQADLSGLDLDSPIPPERLVPPGSADVEIQFGSRYRNFYEMAVTEKLPLRQIMGKITRAVGHLAPTADAGTVADLMQEWYESGVCDGFAVMPAAVPEMLDSICDLLMPELRRRGLAKTEYRGSTLREHLNLPRPATGGAARGW